jgi:thymidylate synthase (FAD)
MSEKFIKDFIARALFRHTGDVLYEAILGELLCKRKALRMAQAAQYEIRCYAEIVGNEIVRRWCPIAWEAFKDYRLDAMSLSRREIEVVRRLQSGDVVGACDTARGFGWLEMGKDGYARNRERQELEEKLLALGFSVPWS